jgi:small subunit ribosomal protein S3
MEKRKFIRIKKEEYGIKEHIKRSLGKGKISKLDIEYTPVGEKIVIYTSRPGLVIGKKGEKIEELTGVLRTRFKLENPHIEIREIKYPLFDSQLVADDIAMALERMGNLKFKVIAYKKLQEIIHSGALGCEIRLSGKLPSERAKSWRFAEGYLKKAGESKKEVDRSKAVALTKTGIIGVKVAIMSPYAKVYDRIDITDVIKSQIKGSGENPEIVLEKNTENEKKTKKPRKKQEEKTDNNIKTEIIEDFPNLSEKEDGTAMKIEEEIEEGVPQEIIDKELKKETEEKIKKPRKKKANKEGEI